MGFNLDSTQLASWEGLPRGMRGLGKRAVLCMPLSGPCAWLGVGEVEGQQPARLAIDARALTPNFRTVCPQALSKRPDVQKVRALLKLGANANSEYPMPAEGLPQPRGSSSGSNSSSAATAAATDIRSSPEGCSVLSLAARWGHVELVACLLQHGEGWLASRNCSSGCCGCGRSGSGGACRARRLGILPSGNGCGSGLTAGAVGGLGRAGWIALVGSGMEAPHSVNNS